VNLRVSFNAMLTLSNRKELTLYPNKINVNMTNNDIFKKLRVALHLKDQDILDIFKFVDFEISKAELGAFFRKEDQSGYKNCGDQFLRNFLNGLVIYKRGTKENPIPQKENNVKKILKDMGKIK
jgi:uncharacterized protein YehS (DUF1456 family)